jgi:uncharacterized BrkB/YihY/UPF0761 family membrane protein
MSSLFMKNDALFYLYSPKNQLDITQVIVGAIAAVIGWLIAHYMCMSNNLAVTTLRTTLLTM